MKNRLKIIWLVVALTLLFIGGTNVKPFIQGQSIRPENALGAFGSQSYVVLGVLYDADFNSTSDQPIAIASGLTAYIPDRIIVANASTSLSSVVGGIYSAPSKGGDAVIAANTTYATLSGNKKSKKNDVDIPDTRNESILYFSLTTPHGSAATADIYLLGLKTNR